VERCVGGELRYKSAMPRYDAYAPQSPTLSPQKGWVISALTGSLVLHAGLFIWFQFQELENFGVTEPPVAREETLQRVKIYEEPAKPEELRMVLPEKKPDIKKELSLPSEVPKPDEISVAPKHKQIDTTQLFATEKPAVEMAKLESAPRTNPDDLLPKLPDDMFNTNRVGPKVSARPMTTTGPDGDGSSKAIQVAGQNVEGILSGLTSGTGTSRRLSLPGNLTFGHDSADVSDDGRGELSKIAEAFRKFLGDELNKATFIIEGHSDPTGTAEYNQRLSERRAEAVRAWFIAQLRIEPSKIQTVGYGATRPAEGVPLDGSLEQMQGHRRTEIIVRRPKNL
jgi:outer membrane protein OmpA-like peptidoglycan-associated protein